MVGQVVADEAQVERHFCAEARVLTAQRTRLNDDQRRAELQILLNYARYFDLETFALQQEERERRCRYSEKRAKAFYAILDSQVENT